MPNLISNAALRILLFSPAQRLRHWFFGALSRNMRRRLIEAMLRPELRTPPRESLPWLLEVHHFLEFMIESQCLRWGDGIHIKHKIMEGIHSFFTERILPTEHVLDVGCGYGVVANAIANETGAFVIGVDSDPGSVAQARVLFQHPNLRFRVADVTKNLPEERVDVVVLSSVIEHIPERVQMLKTLADRFHPRSFLIRVPLFENHYFAALKKELGLFAYKDPTHVTEYSPQSFTDEMEEAGLQIKHMEIRWGDIWAECVLSNERANSD